MSRQKHDPRRHHRYDVRGVRANLMLPLEVRVLNMSLTGLAIESAAPFAVDGRYHLTLRRGDEVVQLFTKVKWCRPVRSEPTVLEQATPVYEIGLDFYEAISEHAQELLGFLEHNAVIELERRRAFGCLWPNGEPTASSSKLEFVIRQLCFTGMLIETVVQPDVDASYDMEMHLDHLELRTTGRVVHTRRASNSRVFQTSIVFPSLTPETQKSFEEIVAHFLE